jgi:hypothetical protein
MSQFWQDIVKMIIDKALLGSIALALVIRDVADLVNFSQHHGRALNRLMQSA